MSLMLDVRTGMSLYVEVETFPFPGAAAVVQRVRLVLRHKKGQVARFEVDAPDDVYVDVTPRNRLQPCPHT